MNILNELNYKKDNLSQALDKSIFVSSVVQKFWASLR